MASEGNDLITLAHSPPRDGASGDPYERHVKAMRQGALERAGEMLRYASNPPSSLLEAIESASTFHDLGKLDPDIQAVFRKGRGSRLTWDHIDAGVAHLSANQAWMAAWLVRAHHGSGLPQKIEHFDPDGLGRRLRGRRNDDAGKERHDKQIERTESLIRYYLKIHEVAVGNRPVTKHRPVHGLAMRLALSCLVDADHTDSAFFDTGQHPPNAPEPRWTERLNSLCDYVRRLPIGETEAEKLRNRRRAEFFEACLESRVNNPLVSCEGSVGLGKTTAVAAYLIRRAEQETLRRLIIVVPFTNILTQTAERLRKALVLPGENPFEVVVEHHHRADFSHIDDRELAVLWRAPVVLTTAVSFFEALAACHPAALRKLHAVPGSAIFLDEAHAALPTKLWPQNFKWVQDLAAHWGCRFVFASGSLIRFWEHSEIVAPPIILPDLLPTDQAVTAMKEERCRVKFVQSNGGRVLEVHKLADLVKKEIGPRLVILNTVQNAAVVAKAMREFGIDVLHLSTALTPGDREKVLQRIDERLLDRVAGNWVLVATSCVEAGVDLSFRCAFRERFSTASTIQIGGRVNRHGEYSHFGPGAVYDFALTGRGITQHPGASISADVLRNLMGKDLLNIGSPTNTGTQAMIEELKLAGGLPSDPLVKAELERDYPSVRELGKVIEADTRFVVVDQNLKECLKERIPVDFRTLLRGSVQLWAHKIDKLRLERLPGRKDIYVWPYDYDPDFLGYMKDMLKLEEFIAEGGAII
jgi:CRISPR-associated endonuclease/helicase Cas3